MQSLKTVLCFIHSSVTTSSFSSQFSFCLFARDEIYPLPPVARHPSCPRPHSALSCHFPLYLKVLFLHPLPLIVSFNLVILQNSFRMLAHGSQVHVSHIYNACFSQFLNAFNLAFSSLLLFTSTAAIPTLPSPRITPLLFFSLNRIPIILLWLFLVLISYNVVLLKVPIIVIFSSSTNSSCPPFLPT